MGLIDKVKGRLGEMKDRFNWQSISTEVGKTFDAKIAQGADELSNALFTGQGYMPWPAQGIEPVENPPEAPAKEAGIDGEITPPEPPTASVNDQEQLNHTIDAEPQKRWNPSEYATPAITQDRNRGIENQGMGH